MNEKLLDTITLSTIIVICILSVILGNFQTIIIPIILIVIVLVAIGILFNKYL